MAIDGESALTSVVRPSLLWLLFPILGAALFASFVGRNVTSWTDHLVILALGFLMPAMFVVGYGSRIRVSNRRIRLERFYGIVEVEWDNIERISIWVAGRGAGRSPTLFASIAPKGDTWAVPGPNAPHNLYMGLITVGRAERAARDIESMAAPFGIPVTIDIH